MTPERTPFERPLDLLEKNKAIAYLALAMIVGGPLAVVGAMARVFPPGVLGLHVALIGLGVALSQSRTNFRAKRRRANVRADGRGVSVDGALVVPRAKIGDGFFQPRLGRDPNKASTYGSSVRLVDKRRRVLFEAEADEGEALAMLTALGLDPGSKRAEFYASSPVYATVARNVTFVFGMMALMVVLGAASSALHLHGAAPLLPLLFMGAIVGSVLPSKIAVGVDGVLVRWLWQKKFLPMAKITRVSPSGDRMIDVWLADGGVETLHTSMRRRGSWGSGARSHAWQHRDAILARMNEALAAFRSRGPGADVSALVGKGTRTREEWLAALAKLRATEGGYRDAVVRDEDLFRVVEDPAAPEDARAGAALLLRRSLDDAGKARVRVAADATASPRLRVVLDAAASERDEEAVRAALEDLARDSDDREPAKRAAR